MPVDRHLFARLKKLLLARDVDHIVQGVEFVASLDDPELWAAVLGGVDWVPEREETVRGRIENHPAHWKPSPLFDGTAPAQPYHDLAMLLLVANAPDGTLRDRIDALRVRTKEHTWARSVFPRLPLDGIERYPNLRRLTVETAVETDLAPLAGCPVLEELRIEGDGGVTLTGLARCRALKSLHVAARLESTDGIAGAPALETVVVSSRYLRDLRGLGQTPVRSVQLRNVGAPVDASGLARAPNLEVLEVDGDVQLGALGGLGVARLEVNGTVHGVLPAMPKLASLSVRDVPKWEVQPALEKLAVRFTTQKVALPPVVTQFPSLRTLELRSGAHADLEALRGSRLEVLQLEQCNVADASALGSLIALKSLGMRGVTTPALDDLPAATLVGADGAATDQLDLLGVRSVRGVGKLAGLKILNLRATPITSLAGLENTAVQVLDLRGCTDLKDVSALGTMKELRLVAMRGTAFHAGNVPEGVGPAVSLAKDPNLRLALRRDPVRSAEPEAAPTKKRRKAPVPAGQEGVWDQLQPLLAAADRDMVDRLVDFLAAHGTEEMFDLLLQPVQANANNVTVRGRLLGPDAELRQIVVQRLAAVGKGKEAVRVRTTPTSWRIDGGLRRGWRSAHGPADLRGLGAFAALTRLELRGASSFVGVEALNDHPSLVELHVQGTASLDDLGALPKVTQIHADGTSTRGLDFAARAPQLTTLTLRGTYVRDIGGLRDHPSLAHLTLELAEGADASPLGTIGTLAQLQLYGVSRLPSLAAAAGLTEVTLRPVNWTDLACLAGLPARKLALILAESPNVRLTGFAAPNLTHLVLSVGNGQRLDALPGPLVRLELLGAYDRASLRGKQVTELKLLDPGDLSFTAGIEGLQLVELHQTYNGPAIDLTGLAPSVRTVELHPYTQVSLAPLRGHPAVKLIRIQRWRENLLTDLGALAGAVLHV